MSDQYDLAIEKISAAMEMAMAAYQSGKPGSGPKSDLELIEEMFQEAFERITDTVSPTLRQDVIPGPPDTSTI
ncbi:MAG: hypothetical protein HYX94_13625 [Chloroflexi bacterium]|nr:hypothetical protein [Chloroflexota bacterium]